MKNILRLSTLLFILCISTVTFAQKNYKFGHIDSKALLESMPERSTAQAALKQAAQELQDEAENMQVEFNNKLESYKASAETMSKAVRENKETELASLQQRIQEFQARAQQDLGMKEKELFEPIMKKAEDAIKEVAKENGFTYIFDINTVLYFSPDSEDILPLVKKKLGIQ